MQQLRRETSTGQGAAERLKEPLQVFESPEPHQARDSMLLEACRWASLGLSERSQAVLVGVE